MCEYHDDMSHMVAVDIGGGQIRSIDKCLVPLVQALNAAGMPTAACCCGHGHIPGVVSLRDGREILITDEDGRGRFLASFGVTITGAKLGGGGAQG